MDLKNLTIENAKEYFGDNIEVVYFNEYLKNNDYDHELHQGHRCEILKSFVPNKTYMIIRYQVNRMKYEFLTFICK